MRRSINLLIKSIKSPTAKNLKSISLAICILEKVSLCVASAPIDCIDKIFGEYTAENIKDEKTTVYKLENGVIKSISFITKDNLEKTFQ